MDSLTLLEELVAMPDPVRAQVLQRADELRKTKTLNAIPKMAKNNIPEQASLASLITGKHAMGPQVIGAPPTSAMHRIRSQAGRMGALQSAIRRP